MKKYLIALVMVVMIMSCFFGKTLVMANEESDDTVYNRYYTTIEVEKGDTLWSIAKTYYHHSGMSVREYVYELKLINGMVSDEIRAGNMISVEYYAEIWSSAMSSRDKRTLFPFGCVQSKTTWA